MKTALALAVVVASWTTTAYAQPPASPTPAAWLRGAYTNISRYIPRAAEKMPEEHYGLRPGTQPRCARSGS
jgi:hypothetical protein